MLYRITFKNTMTGRQIEVYKRGLSAEMAIEKARAGFAIPVNHKVIGAVIPCQAMAKSA